MVKEVGAYIYTAMATLFLSYYTLQYYALVVDGKNIEKDTTKHRVIYLICVLNGLLGIFGSKHLKSVYEVFLICCVIGIEGWILTKQSKNNLMLGVFFLLAAILNYSCSYILFYCINEMVCAFFTIEETKVFFALVYGTSAFASGLLACFLNHPGNFPNDALRILLMDAKKRFLIFIYFCIFCSVNIVTLFCFVPVNTRISIDKMDHFLLLFDAYVKTSLVLFSSFFLVFYFCKFSGSENNAENLEYKLKHETSYRRSVLSDALMSYCINLDQDSIVDGGEYFADRFPGQKISFFEAFSTTNREMVHPDDIAKIEPFLRKETALKYMEKQKVRCERVRIRKSAVDIPESDSLFKGNDEWFWVETRYTLTKDEDDGQNYMYITISNIHEQVEEELELREAAEHDALTGLYNRAYVEKELKERLSKGESVSLFMIDADHLKQVNDLIGHAAGDRMLINVAQILRKEFDSEDVVARLGGDEFVAISKGNRSLAELGAIAQRLNESARISYTAADGQKVSTSASIGIAISPLHGKTASELMGNADYALYCVKNTTRDSYKIYNLSLREEKTV